MEINSKTVRINFKAVIIGAVIAAFLSLILSYLGYLIGGLVVGYLIVDDYVDGAVNGALAGGVAGLIQVLFLTGIMGLLIGRAYSPYFSAGVYFISMIFVGIIALVAGLIMGGIGGLLGILVQEKFQQGNHAQNENFQVGNMKIQPKAKNGYLVCSVCGGYYQLNLGESPNDFSDTCECGGKLEYRSELGN